MKWRLPEYRYRGLLLLGVIPLVVSILLTSWGAITTVAGTHDTWYLRQWYDPEPIAGRMMRWSEPTATVTLPALRAGWHVAEFWLLNGRPNGTPAQVVTVAGATPAVAITVEGWQLRRYAMLWHAPAHTWGADVTLTVATAIQTVEQRHVGVLLAQWRSTPTVRASVWQSYVGLVLVLTALAVWVWLGLLDVRHARYRVGVPVLVVGALAVALVLHPATTLPWVQWPLVCVLTALAWQGWVRQMGWVRVTPQGQLVVPGQLLPLLMGSAWLVMPWLQQAVMAAGIYVRGFAVYPFPLLGWSTGALVALAIMQRVAHWRQWSQWPQLSQWGVVLVCGVSTLVYLTQSWYALQHVGSADFDVWVIAARRWLATGSFYDVPQIAGDVFGYVYKYPPLYGMVFIPLAGYAEMELLRIYRVIDVVLLVWTAVIWLHIIKPRQWGWWLGALLISVNLNPVLETLKYGQIDVVVLWLCSIIYWCLYYDYDDIAGWLVAFLISIKMYPALFFIWFLLKRRWYAVRGTIIGGIVLNLLAMAVVGWHEYYTFVFAVLPIIGGTTAYVENQTIAAFVARLVAPSYPLAPFTDPLWAPLTTLISLMVLVGLCVVAAKTVPVRHPAYALQYGLVVMMTALAIPVAWIGYQVPLWLVLIVVLWYGAPRPVVWWQATVLAGSFAFIGFGNFLSFVFAVDVGWLTVLIDSYKLYGMLGLTLLMCVWVWQTAADSHETPISG